jgi:hypothetical protein
MSEITIKIDDSTAKTCEERMDGTAAEMMEACCVEKEVDMEFYKKYQLSDCGCRTRCRCDCHDCAVASMVRH